MGSKIDARHHSGIGRAAIMAAIAGVAGVVLALVVASNMFFNALGAEQRVLEPGYLDYGQRHPHPNTEMVWDEMRGDYRLPNPQSGARNDIVAPGRSGQRLDDYGIRCVEAGWCNVAPGADQPARPE